MTARAPLKLRGRRAMARLLFGTARTVLGPLFGSDGHDDLPPPRSVLVVNLLGIGDHVTALPALEAVRASLPEGARLEVLLSSGPQIGRHAGPVELYRLGPAVDAVHLYGTRSDARAQRGRHDRILVLGARAHDAMVGRLAAGGQGPAGERPIVAGFDHGGRGFALDRRVPLPEQAFRPVSELVRLRDVRHQVDVWLGLVEAAGLATAEACRSAAETGPRLSLPESTNEDVRELAKETGLDPDSVQDVVVLHGWNEQAHYRWPVERWAELGARLLDEKESHACVITGPHGKDATDFCAAVEAELTRRFGQSTRGRLANLAGRLDLCRLAALAKAAHAFVSVDTGATHLAAAAGASVVALFGPGSPKVWGPWGDGHIVVQEQIGCHGCRLPSCIQPSHECMDGVSVDQVAVAIHRIGRITF